MVRMATMAHTTTVKTGLETLLDETSRGGRLRGARVGLVCNPASVDTTLVHAADRLIEAGVKLTALFGPQHGFRSDLQDNMIETPHARDARRRVPVYSLYSETREPTPEMLKEVDLLVVDLQDVGTRVYTFVYTMANCLRAAVRHRLPVLVCDRPNPIGGTQVEGPVLDPAFASFVGQFAIPLRHGMTMAELARLFNDEFGIGAEVEIVPLRGWERAAYYDVTGLPWVMPSPNMPSLETAVVYPGMVLFEGTQLSEGRGTTRPFELVGAPWIDGDRFSDAMNARALPGVRFRAAFFEPTFQKHARQTCGGCQLHVTDRQAFQPVRTAVALLDEFRRQDPARFQWRQPPYEYEHEKMPIDILSGSPALRAQIERDEDPLRIEESWMPGLERFAPVRAEYLLY
jgi:uncharacterized protein YbbC (DUF1343 family)